MKNLKLIIPFLFGSELALSDTDAIPLRCNDLSTTKRIFYSIIDDKPDCISETRWKNRSLDLMSKKYFSNKQADDLYRSELSISQITSFQESDVTVLLKTLDVKEKAASASFRSEGLPTLQGYKNKKK